MLDFLGVDRAEFNDWALVSLAPWPAWVSVLLVALGLLAVGMSFWGVHGESRGRRVATLTSLRVLGVLIGLMLLLQPAIQLRKVNRIRNRVPVLVDRSQSMSLQADADEPSRLEVASKFLENAAPGLAALGQEYAFDFFAFDSGASPVSQNEAQGRLKPEGEATDLIAALKEATASVPRERLGGILVVTDGADNGRLGRDPELMPEAAKDFIEGLDAPIHTFGVGISDDFKDIAIEAVEADDFAFVRNTVEITVVVRSTGYTGVTVPVTLRQEGQVLMSRQLTLTPGQTLHRVSFSFSPKRIGKFIYGVSIPVYDEEAIRSNNAKNFVLKVIRDKIRVLQVCGRPSWDERFMRQMLKENPNIDLISFFILRTPEDDVSVPNNELSLIPFPTRELFTQQLHTFDLVIFQNFTYKPYRMQDYLKNIHDFVERDGGGFLMIGGELSFAPGHYGGTYIEQILPVSVGHVDRLGGAALSYGEFRGGPSGVDLAGFLPRLTEEGRRHPITDLARGLGDNDAIWQAMPQMPGTNLVRDVKPDATVLLEHPFLKVTGKNAPVVSVREVGRGRTMAVTLDSTWHWSFVAAGQGGSRRYYHDFWSNAIRWLIRDPELTRLRVAPTRESYRPGERVVLEVRALDQKYRPAEKATIDLEITSPDESFEPIHRSGTADAEGNWNVELAELPPGPYKVRARATSEKGTDLGTEENALVVKSAGKEFEDARPGRLLLEALSEMSGGEFYTLPRSELPELELNSPRTVKINRKRNIEVWNHWAYLLGLALFLGAEWFLRRRWGFL